MWESTILGQRFLDLTLQHALFSAILWQRILDLEIQIHLGVYSVAFYSMGVYNSRATDFGSGEANAYP